MPHLQPRRQRPAFLDVGGGEKLFERVARLVASEWNTTGQCALVVGATFPQEIARVRASSSAVPLLVPGIGAQGGDIEATVRGWAHRLGWRLDDQLLARHSGTRERVRTSLARRGGSPWRRAKRSTSIAEARTVP